MLDSDSDTDVTWIFNPTVLLCFVAIAVKHIMEINTEIRLQISPPCSRV